MYMTLWKKSGGFLVTKTVSLLEALVGNVLVHLAFIMYQNLRISEKLISQFLWWSVKLNTVGENRTGRSVAIAPGVWRHWITLAMRHQHQLLLPCLVASRGGPASAVWVHKMCPPSLSQTRNTCGPSHGRQAADQGHVCICVLVAYQINLWGPAAGVAFCLLGLNGIAFFAQWISVYNVNLTTILATATNTDS